MRPVFYNQTALHCPPHLRMVPAAALLALLCGITSGCVHPLGPGYLVEKQQIEVQFFPASPQKIRVDATYQLRNTGNQPLASLDARLPGGRRLHVAAMQLTWDGKRLEVTPSPDTPRNSSVDLPQSWVVSARHTLHLSYDIVSAAPEETGLSFAEDAFFLPSANWNAEFLPSRGLFGFGGEPPRKWELMVRVPPGFLVHTSGMSRKQARKGGEEIARSVQTPADHYPFVVAARYTSAEIGDGKHRVFLWTRSQPDADSLRQASQEVARTTAVYDGMFGSRTTKKDAPLWIVECPDTRGCLSTSSPVATLLLGEDAAQSTAEMVSADTLMVDLSAGTPRLVATVAPSLAASWLGYGQNPGFYEQVPPLSLLPAFAAAIGREALVGPAYRGEVIRRALRVIPGNSAAWNASGRPKEEDPGVVRAKSLLFFYALQDRYGPEVFRKGVTHMLEARRGRGFDISDLIASFEQETHQNTAEFVRMWMKRPGVPDDFRAQYESKSTAENSVKETFR